MDNGRAEKHRDKEYIEDSESKFNRLLTKTNARFINLKIPYNSISISLQHQYVFASLFVRILTLYFC
jgi:hypothetical protein